MEVPRYCRTVFTWAHQMEAAADRRGLPTETTDLARTVGDLISRYRDTVVPRKRGAEIETFILNAFMRHKVARLPLSEASSEHFSRYRDERLERVKPVTVSRELGIIQHAFEVARKANKYQISAAVETIYGVVVANVRTMTVPGKLKRRGSSIGR